MCGIYGTTKVYTKEVLSKKLDRVKFRGPDFTRFEKINDKVVFGHNRLSIIDLDSRSNQPFHYQEKISIVFNGEIYNFHAVREKLVTDGFIFNTMSDTEVICAAYLRYGKDCVKHLNGMFAFVIFDKSQNILFGARDRLGQKPLYYYLDGKDLEFSSQLSQIRIGNNLSINQDAIAKYLCWNYIPDPISIYNGVQKLEAGYAFTYDLSTGNFKTERYWDIDSVKYAFTGRTYDEAKNNLHELLKDAVKGRMISDVPLGVFLSGGVDSSLIAALAQDHFSSPVKTFSVSFDEKKFDESKYASKVAKILNTDHTEIQCNYSEGLDLIEQMGYFFDEPFADSSAIPSMLLSKHTQKHVTVALSGDAGDESFLGYTRYDWIKQVNSLYKLPTVFRKYGSSFLSKLPNYKYQLIAEGLKMDTVEELYIRMVSSMNDVWHTCPDLGRKQANQEWLESGKKLLERVSDYDLKTYLNGDINTKVDRATMAYSLEVRAPLMDYRIIEFARSLPTSFKYNKGVKKRILKDILYEYLPKSIFERPKSGFGMPLEVWFRNDLKEYVLDNLTTTRLREIPFLDVSLVEKQIKEHINNKANRTTLIWKLLVLNSWMQEEGERGNL